MLIKELRAQTHYSCATVSQQFFTQFGNLEKMFRMFKMFKNVDSKIRNQVKCTHNPKQIN